MSSNLSTPEPDPQHKPNDPCIADLVIADHQERKQFGIAKYGDCLKLDDGRNPAIDLYQELLDANVYGRKLVSYVEGLLVKIKSLESEVSALRAARIDRAKDFGRITVPPHMAHLITDGYIGGVRAHVAGVGEVLKASDVPGGVAGEKVHALPKAYVDRPWVEMDVAQTCACCGEEKPAGMSMRKDDDGLSCSDCVHQARRERRLGRRGL